jgi:hypothetical protein
LAEFYPWSYPVSPWWFGTDFATVDTMGACERGVQIMPAIGGLVYTGL